MNPVKRRAIIVMAYALMMLALGACVPTHRITLHDDGTFDPPTLAINEGDVVYWARGRRGR